MAVDLLSDPAAVIVALAPLAVVAAKNATTTIPIVLALGADPVGLGLVSSLNRPGGNVTGAPISFASSRVRSQQTSPSRSPRSSRY